VAWQCNVIVIASEAWQSHPYVIARNEVTWQCNVIVIARNEVTWQCNVIVIARNEVTWQSHKNEMHFVPGNYPIPFSRLL
jgi:hypothetical protein